MRILTWVAHTKASVSADPPTTNDLGLAARPRAQVQLSSFPCWAGFITSIGWPRDNGIGEDDRRSQDAIR